MIGDQELDWSAQVCLFEPKARPQNGTPTRPEGIDPADVGGLGGRWSISDTHLYQDAV